MFSCVLKKCFCSVSETAVVYVLAKRIGEEKKKSKQVSGTTSYKDWPKIQENEERVPKRCRHSLWYTPAAARSCLVKGSGVSKGSKLAKEEVFLVLLCQMERARGNSELLQPEW